MSETQRRRDLNFYVTLGILGIVAFFVCVTVWRAQYDAAAGIVLSLVGYLGGRAHERFRGTTKDGTTISVDPVEPPSSGGESQ